mgnify:FL=1
MFWKKTKNDEKSVFDFPHADKLERQHSLMGFGVTIKGNIQFAGSLRVDGRLDGRVDIRPEKRGTLIVSKHAVINGPVYVTNLVVDGTINGDVWVTGRLECRANGKIKGEVKYQKITLMEGAVIDGRCISVLDLKESEKVVSVVRDGDETPKISSFLGKEK